MIKNNSQRYLKTINFDKRYKNHAVLVFLFSQYCIVQRNYFRLNHIKINRINWLTKILLRRINLIQLTGMC